jgi:uncharacterized protein
LAVLHAVRHAFAIAGFMTWEILWALILGFVLSAIVQALVSRESIVRLLGDDRPRTLLRATGFGAASSSCSYAAVALARSLFVKGAGFLAAMTFEMASTNLVVELGIILALLLAWQFTLAEFLGGAFMIVVLAVIFRLLLSKRLVAAARAQAQKGVAGSMEGHASMDMSIRSTASFRRRLFSPAGVTAVAHVFVTEWVAVLRDIVGGLLIAGALAAWVPATFWQQLFLHGHPLLSKIWGPLIGPVVAVISFVCSIGNVPLAAVLWNGEISFGGVVSFIFADLIIIPILIIYRKYYGTRAMLFIAGCFYAAMVAAGYFVEIVFGALGLVPGRARIQIDEPSISLNYTTALNIVFLLLAAVLLWRFFRTGGRGMLRMMGGKPDLRTEAKSHEHGAHHGAHQMPEEPRMQPRPGQHHEHERCDT